jgi:chromosome segregation ATPase
MKKSIFNRAVTASFMAGTIFVLIGCQSSDQKVQDAQDKVKDANQNMKQVQSDANVEEQKKANAEAWKMVKNEWEAKIKNNDIVIADLKSHLKKPGKAIDAAYEKSINDLQQRNKDMKARIDAYDKSQSDWESFKREFTHDMEGLGQALNDLTVNNKK